MNSFLHGKAALALAPLRPPPGLTRSLADAAIRRTDGAATPGPATTTVEAVKEGDKVVRLVVTCACGERIEVECLYPAGS
jgi:hypothetical protein